MKATNLKILLKNGFNVPNFYTVTKKSIYKIGNSLKDNKRYAVRSSAKNEDSDSESHAGEYKTYLNVDKNDIIEKVQDVLNSYNSDNKNNIAIIQEMIDADLSGVMFTASPVGVVNSIRIVIGKGLGENVVDNKVNTTIYSYNRDDDICQYITHGESPILQDNILKHLIKIAFSVRNLFKKEMDIEFCIKDNVVYLLQARPITTIHYDNLITLDNSNIVESYPGIVLPFTQSYVKMAYRDIMKNLITRLTNDDKLVNSYQDTFENMVAFYNGRAYYVINNWYDLLQLIPFDNKIISIWQKSLGITNKHVSYKKRNIRKITKATIIKNTIKYLNDTPKLMQKFNVVADKQYHLLKVNIKNIKNNISDPMKKIHLLLECITTTKDSLMKDWDVTLINDMYTFIYTNMAGKNAKDYINNIKSLESMKPVKELANLSSIIKFYTMNSARYKVQKEKFIEEYGDRCIGELKFETKTYRTNPELLDEYLINNTIDRVHYYSSNKIDNNVIEKAKIGISNREMSRLYRTKMFGIIRDTIITIGKELEKLNLIDNYRDVFYLTLDKLININKYKDDYKNIIAIEKEIYADYEKTPEHSRLVFQDIVEDSYEYKYTESTLGSKVKIQGEPTSNGVVEGEALVIKDNTNIKSADGKIIVTVSTDPGWVYLIKQAKGIIAERGSLLSHTAIISRELSKPAIVNVKNATRLIKTGDYIRLNANNGCIQILKRKNNK